MYNNESQRPNEAITSAPIVSEEPNVQKSHSGLTLPRQIALLISVLVLGIILIFLTLNYFHLLPVSKPHSISKSVPVTLNLARGKLVLINGTNITVNVYGNLKSFSISGTKDFNKVVSGEVEKGDIKTGLASISELKVDQDVLVIADAGSIEAKTIYIFNKGN